MGKSCQPATPRKQTRPEPTPQPQQHMCSGPQQRTSHALMPTMQRRRSLRTPGGQAIEICSAGLVPDSSRLSTHESAVQRANGGAMRHCPRALLRPAMTCGRRWVRFSMEQLWPEGAAVALVSYLRHTARQAAWAAEPSLPQGASSPAGPMPPDMHVAVTPNLHCGAHSSGISVIRPQRLQGSAAKEWPQAPLTVVAPAAAAAVRPSRLILRAPRRFG